ncbi:MAG: lipid A biosynthesis acyltransferase, partial [Gammaproteobacteria bacterium]|nr:lipid A biosynthesis acyltransferase [Gammaproteobacteria bacterium]
MLASFIKFILRLTAILSLPLAHRFGHFIGWLFIILPNKSKQVAQKNIELCFPELNNIEQKKLLQENLIETGRTLAEMGLIWLSNSERVLNL